MTARPLWFALGTFSVALGAIGIALPLLPTVPFMILAAFCFAKSSPALEKRLIEHPVFGPHIIQWREKGAVSRRGKWAATLAFAFSIAIGFVFLVMPWSFIPMAAALIAGTWLWMRPES